MVSHVSGPQDSTQVLQVHKYTAEVFIEGFHNIAKCPDQTIKNPLCVSSHYTPEHPDYEKSKSIYRCVTAVVWLSAYIFLFFKNRKTSTTVILGVVKSKIILKNSIKRAQSHDKLFQDVGGHGEVHFWGGGGDCG